MDQSRSLLVLSIGCFSVLFAGCGARTKAPLALNYASSTTIYAKGVAIQANMPSVTGGSPTAYSVNPALPAGLTLNSSSGMISGSPTTVAPMAKYTVSATNSAGQATTSLGIAVTGPLSADNINLIFVVSPDLAFQGAGDINPSTANLTSQGLQRALSMASFLKQQVLGAKNVSSIYALSPMTHLQTTSDYPDMVPLESIQQFALLNQIMLPADGTPRNSYPLHAAYADGSPLPADVAPPLVPCAPSTCQGLDFADQANDNDNLVSEIIQAKQAGFYVFSAPWETTSHLLANINYSQGNNLVIPSTYQGPNYIYAISIPTTGGSPSFVTYDTHVNPSGSFPALTPAPARLKACAPPSTIDIHITGGHDGAVIPTGINTNQTFYIVRHADAHPVDAFEDGNYVGAGQWRALDLPNTLTSQISPDEVWSIDPAQSLPIGPNSYTSAFASYVRPSLTVAPFAIANNLPYRLAASFEMGMATAGPALQAKNFFFTNGSFSNKKVLLAWESKHIPLTVNSLISSYFPDGNPPATLLAPDWVGTDYDSVWTVKLDAQGNLTVDNAICEGIDSSSLPATAPPF